MHLIARYKKVKIIFQFRLPCSRVSLDRQEGKLIWPPSGLQPRMSCLPLLPGLFTTGELVPSDRGMALLSPSITR